MRKQPLKVEINNGRLEISIGVDLLCFAIEHGPIGDGLNITDADVFIGEVLNGLLLEEEDGSTPVHRMLDSVADKAVDDGADGCSVDSDFV